MKHDLILALDIGGTKLAVGVAERGEFVRTGKLARIVKEPVSAPGTPESVIPRLLELALELAAAEQGTISSVGISIGGPLDHTTGTVVNFPHLPGWKDVPLCAEIRTALGVPATLDNDANLGALAEHRLGAGKRYDDLVYLTISTGIGGGVIIDRKLRHGIGSGAGEVGHITVQTGGPYCACGNVGCLETMASGRAIARRAVETLTARPSHGRILRDLIEGDTSRVTAEIVLQAALQGDDIAGKVWNETAEYIAIGLANIIHVLAPPIIVLGGGVAQAGDALIKPIRERLRHHVFYIPLDQIEVVTAALGHDSAILGAALLAISPQNER